MFCDSNPRVFAIINLNQHAFSVLKGVTPTFSNFGTLLKIDMKNCPLLGKLLSVWKTFQHCSAESHIAFSMFPILDTNLWSLYVWAINDRNLTWILYNLLLAQSLSLPTWSSGYDTRRLIKRPEFNSRRGKMYFSLTFTFFEC